MLFIVGERSVEDNKLTFISPALGIEYDVDASLLELEGINLGDYCNIDIKNNIPQSFKLDRVGIPDAKVNLNENLAEVTGVTGTLVEKLALFYKTKQFGDVAWQDEVPGEVGKKYSITISRLPLLKRVGMYARCVWGAVSNGEATPEIKKVVEKTTTIVKKRNSENKKYAPVNLRNELRKKKSQPGVSQASLKKEESTAIGNCAEIDSSLQQTPATPETLPTAESSQSQECEQKKSTFPFPEEDSDVEKKAVKKLKLKRAMVTRIKPNLATNTRGKDSVADVWLLDDHIPAKFSFSSAKYSLRVNHFFEGLFFLHKSRWVCKSFEKSLGELINGIVTVDGKSELHITVNEYFPLDLSENRISAETRHLFIGRIIDEFEILPTDCSGGVKIAIRLLALKSRQRFCWVVSRVFQSKYIQTLTEFHKVWKIAGMRDLIRSQCYNQFKALHYLFDTSEENPLVKHLGISKAEVHQEVYDNDESNGESKGEVEKFAWTTECDGDVVSMVVFPRIPGLRMSQMKKSVTDRDVYQEVEKMTNNTLYRVELNKRREVVKMWDCPQHIVANELGRFVLQFIASGDLLLAKNVSVVESVGLPKAFGKLLFHLPGFPISTTKRILAKADFRFIEDNDCFADHDIVMENNVSFLCIANIEKLEDIPITKTTETVAVRKHSEPKEFKKRLGGMSNESVFSMFKDICRTISNQKVLELMEKRNFNAENLFELTKRNDRF